MIKRKRKIKTKNQKNKRLLLNKQIIRRNKNSPDKREYTCKCGKEYFSYPAIYTHVRKKHESNNNEYIHKKNRVQQLPESSIISINDDSVIPINQCDESLRLEFPTLASIFQSNELFHDDNLFQGFEMSFPKSYFYFEEDYLYAFNQLSYHKSSYSSTNGLKMKDIPISLLISLFLYSNLEGLSLKSSQIMLIFFSILIKFLNEFGWFIIQDEMSRKGIDINFQKSNKFVECNEGEFIFTGMNFFLEDFLIPEARRILNNKSAIKFFKSEKLIKRVIEIFNEWLLEKKLISSSLVIAFERIN